MTRSRNVFLMYVKQLLLYKFFCYAGARLVLVIRLRELLHRKQKPQPSFRCVPSNKQMRGGFTGIHRIDDESKYGILTMQRGKLLPDVGVLTACAVTARWDQSLCVSGEFTSRSWNRCKLLTTPATAYGIFWNFQAGPIGRRSYFLTN